MLYSIHCSYGKRQLYVIQCIVCTNTNCSCMLFEPCTIIYNNWVFSIQPCPMTRHTWSILPESNPALWLCIFSLNSTLSYEYAYLEYSSWTQPCPMTMHTWSILLEPNPALWICIPGVFSLNSTLPYDYAYLEYSPWTQPCPMTMHTWSILPETLAEQ